MTCRTPVYRCWGTAAVFLILAGLLGPAADTAHAKKMPLPRRFSFKIDPKTRLADLLPPAPDAMTPVPPWLVRELSEVPEILFAKPEAPIKRLALPTPTTAEEKRKALESRFDAEDKAMERTAHIIAKINHLNQTERDRFLAVLRERRRDLDGLPFVMGDACRQKREEAFAFAQAVGLVRTARSVAAGSAGKNPPKAGAAERGKHFWAVYGTQPAPDETRGPVPIVPTNKLKPLSAEARTALTIAALMQMLAPEEAALQQGLVEKLARLNDAAATHALARLALYSTDATILAQARDALKSREPADYTDILLAGLRYPWPAVAQNAGEAMIQLACKDLVPQLVALLDEPDSRAPATVTTDGSKTLVVREVVRINHFRSCLLCHPPGNTPDVISDRGFPRGEIVSGAVPSPGVELPPPSVGYGSGSPDILVRADVTYLRQDFSRMQAVKDVAPWPTMQRFDFLVRTRVVTEKDAAAYQAWLKQHGPNYLPPHRQAALTALRALTGRDAAPTARAWRAALAQNKEPEFKGRTLNEWAQRLQSDDIGVRQEAVLALHEFGPGAVPAITEALKDKEVVNVRIWAAWGLRRLGAKAKAAVPQLEATLKDECSLVRVEAAKALWAISEQKTAIPALIALLKHEDPNTRWEAAEVLGNIGPKAKAAVPALVAALKDTGLAQWTAPNGTVRRQPVSIAAGKALKKIDPEAATR